MTEFEKALYNFDSSAIDIKDRIDAFEVMVNMFGYSIFTNTFGDNYCVIEISNNWSIFKISLSDGLLRFHSPQNDLKAKISSLLPQKQCNVIDMLDIASKLI